MLAIRSNDFQCQMFAGAQDRAAADQATPRRQPGNRRERTQKRTETAAAPVLMTQACFRAPSIERMVASRALCEASRSAAADSPRLGSGSVAKTLVRPCIRRLSVVAGTARTRWLWQLAAACWAAVLTAMFAEAGRALGPMLTASAREHWPSFVVRDSCHTALPDQPGLPQIASGHWTGDSRRHSRPIRLVTDGYCIDVAGARPCHVSMLLPARKSVAQTAVQRPFPTPDPKLYRIVGIAATKSRHLLLACRV